MAGKLQKLKSSLKQSFSALKTLTKMQLKEKMDMSYMRTTKGRIFHTVYFILEFLLVGAICFGLFYVVNLLGIFSLTGDIPVSVTAIVLGAMLLLSIIFTTIGLVQSLYLARDNMVLLTLPAKPSIVFLSKLLVYYVYELRKNFLFLIPFFFAYGLIKALPFWYFFWALFLFVFISLLPVLVAALLSMPALWIYQICRRHRWVQYVLMTAGVGLAAWLVVSLIGLIPDNIDILASWGTTYWEIQDFLKAFTKAFPTLMGFTELIVGRSVGLTNVVMTAQTPTRLLILIGVIVVLIVLCFLLSQPLFYKMASTPFEYKKKVIDQEKANKVTPVFLSSVKKEAIIGLRNNSIFSLAVQLCVILPIAIDLLNRLYAAMSTRFLGMQLALAFNIIIVLLFMMGSTISIASAYSRDGSTAYLNKVQPSTYGKLLFSKLVINLVIGLIGAVATGIIFSQYSGLKPLENILFTLTIYFMYVAHLFWSAEMDIMNPQYEQYSTFAEQSNNPNENKSTLLCFFLSIIIGVLFLLFSFEGLTGAWIRVACVSAVICAMKITTYFLKIKVFYKEK